MFHKLGALLADVGNSIHDLKGTFSNAGAVYGFLSHSVTAYYRILLVCIFLLLSLGVIGQYIGKIYMETKHRPRYIISKRTWERPPQRP